MKPKAPATPETFRTQGLDERTRTLLEEPLPRILFQLAAPNALVMLTQISISLIELFFVGKLGVDALAGVSQVFPILSLVGAISQGAVGGGVVSAVARTLGRGDRAHASALA
jgi:Na+-driven multidrug efflux pump